MTFMLLRPLWLFALLPLTLMALVVWRQRAAGGWERIIAPALLGFLRDHGHLGPARRPWRLMLPFAVAGLQPSP